MVVFYLVKSLYLIVSYCFYKKKPEFLLEIHHTTGRIRDIYNFFLYNSYFYKLFDDYLIFSVQISPFALFLVNFLSLQAAKPTCRIRNACSKLLLSPFVAQIFSFKLNYFILFN